MDYRELLEEYNNLLEQVDRLTKENIQLRAQLGLPESERIQKTTSVKSTGRKIPDDESAAGKSFSDVDNQSDTFSKIRLFMSLFKGREDVYAKRWENKNKGFANANKPIILIGAFWQPLLDMMTQADTDSKLHVKQAETPEKAVELLKM